MEDKLKAYPQNYVVRGLVFLMYIPGDFRVSFICASNGNIWRGARHGKSLF
jgi:hypothetical protein